MLHIGLDVHYRTSRVCILNEYGRKVKHKTFRGPWEKVVIWPA